MKSSHAFSLIELVVVMAVIATLSGIFIFNFRSSSDANALNQVAHVVSSDIRRMQSMATAGSSFEGSTVCGFGVHYVDAKTYLLFARPTSGATPCASDLRAKTYLVGDLIVEQKKLGNPGTIMASSFGDVFYELPHPTTYLNGLSSPGQISIEIVAASAPTQPGVVVTVFSSGKVNIQ